MKESLKRGKHQIESMPQVSSSFSIDKQKKNIFSSLEK